MKKIIFSPILIITLTPFLVLAHGATETEEMMGQMGMMAGWSFWPWFGWIFPISILVLIIVAIFALVKWMNKK